MTLLPALLVLLSPLSAFSAELNQPAAPRSLTVVKEVFSPSHALPAAIALPAGPDLRLDPAAQAAMANPVPVAAMGLRASHFTTPTGLGQARPSPASATQAPASPLADTRRVADAALSGASERVSGLVFDGSRSAGPVVSVQAPSSVRAPSGAALLRSLHEQTGRGYRAHDYDEAHLFLFGTADQVVVDGKHGVVDAYSGVFEPGTSTDGGRYGEHGDENHDGRVDTGMNVEHVWPQSFFSKQLPMRSDLHHLMATFVYPNGVRGNLPFGEVRGRGDYSNDAGAKRGQGVFEPPDATKGRVARALLYFYTRYYDRNITNGAFGEGFWNSKLDMLLRWNRQYPPTAWERARNDAVERFQGNRNPFVDDPSMADRVGADAFRRVPALQFHERRRIIERRALRQD